MGSVAAVRGPLGPPGRRSSHARPPRTAGAGGYRGRVPPPADGIPGWAGVAAARKAAPRGPAIHAGRIRGIDGQGLGSPTHETFLDQPLRGVAGNQQRRLRRDDEGAHREDIGPCLEKIPWSPPRITPIVYRPQQKRPRPPACPQYSPPEKSDAPAARDQA